MPDTLRERIAQAAAHEYVETSQPVVYMGPRPAYGVEVGEWVASVAWPLVEQAIREERETFERVNACGCEHDGKGGYEPECREHMNARESLAALHKEFTELSEYHTATTIERAQEVAEKDKQIRDIWARMMKAESALAEIRNAQQAQVSSTERERLARLRETPAPPEEPT